MAHRTPHGARAIIVTIRRLSGIDTLHSSSWNFPLFSLNACTSQCPRPLPEKTWEQCFSKSVLLFSSLTFHVDVVFVIWASPALKPRFKWVVLPGELKKNNSSARPHTQTNAQTNTKLWECSPGLRTRGSQRSPVCSQDWQPLQDSILLRGWFPDGWSLPCWLCVWCLLFLQMPLCKISSNLHNLPETEQISSFW